MPMRLKIAFRNVFRNGGRTILSILMIAGAVTGLILFRGFAENMLKLLQDVEIEYESGHMQAATHDYWEQTPGKRQKFFVHDHEKIEAVAIKYPELRSVSSRLSSFGLVSTGDVTISAKALGIDILKESSMFDSLIMVSGQKLSPDSKLECLLGAKLQKQLGVKVGDSITLLGYTVDNVINALDLTVRGIFLTGRDDIDKFVTFVPLKTIQTLLDTQDVENIVVRLHKTEDVARMQAIFQKEFSKIDSRIEVKDWYTLSTFYKSVQSFYKVQNRVFSVILISLVLLGIINTVGMSIYERTGEIGTVRALGESEASVIAQFTLEGFILGMIGYVTGMILAAILAQIVNHSHITMVMPNASVDVPVGIKLVVSAFVEAAFVSVVTATLATWWPSLRASRMSIVEALKRNI
jgi:putative ABC transport system permease protein